MGAIARKLAVAIWYLMMGRWTALEEMDKRLGLKVNKMISSVGAKGLKQLQKTRKAYKEEIRQSLIHGRVYLLDPDKKFGPLPAA